MCRNNLESLAIFNLSYHIVFNILLIILLFTVELSYNIVLFTVNISYNIVMVSGRFTYVGIPYTRTDTGQTDTGQTATGQTSV